VVSESVSCGVLEADALPETTEELRALVLEQRAALRERDGIIERLKAQLAWLRRQQFGRSSEKIEREIAQLELQLEDLEESSSARAAARSPDRAVARPARHPLPDHLPREEIVHEPACSCPACGSPLRRLGEDVSEMLEYVPASFRVIRHVRPKLSCARCERIVQSEAPSRPIARGLAGPGLLAHVLVAKYADHLPLYRQSAIYAREGVELERSTLADWVGSASALLQPLVEALAKETLRAGKLHTDDTPVPVLAPGRGTTRTGRLWVYVRDDRPAGDSCPPSVLFRYSSDRKGERPQDHLRTFKGFLQADGYAGYNRLYGNEIVEVACWAHVRRKFHDVYVDQASPLAREALERIGALYDIEAIIRGHAPAERQAVRQARAGPLLEELRQWLDSSLRRVPGRSDLAAAIRYTRSRWDQLCRYRDDGRLEIDNSAAERALRGVALGRKNWLFAGSDAGGQRAAAIYSLIETCKLSAIDPEAYLRHVLSIIADHPINRVAELLPWNISDNLVSGTAPVA
jgi:transposase